MRALVTGGHGFAGSWLAAHLEEAGDLVVAPDEVLDVTDAAVYRDVVVAAEPDAVYHLAARSHVGESWDAPQEVLRVNALGTLNVLEAARACRQPPRVLVVSSAEVYGSVPAEALPITEAQSLAPLTPYASSKVAAEYLALQAYLGYGLHVVRVRSFNHIGPGQSDSFVVSALAARIVAAERAGARKIAVGNLEARRDFTDVRDVVRAYRLLMEQGEPGEVYNVCSGRDHRIEDLAIRLVRMAPGSLELVPEPSLQRPVEVPVLRGDPGKLVAACGWQPRIELDRTLADVLESWRELPTPAATA